MKIYTKTGDKGTSSLCGGTRVSKDDIRLEAYGNIDELNAFMGLLLTEELTARDSLFVQNIQHQLFKIGAYLATDQSACELKDPQPVTDDMLQTIESEIDLVTSQLPEIRRFILPGGNKASSLCHVCRTVCRRSERHVVMVSRKFPVENNIMIYLNRLSDYFFVLGRKCNLNGGTELFWDNTK
jgi:ATP:cob(I)alamin adenosyltransferase